MIYAEIEFINGDDLAFARRYIIGEEEIRRMKATALVDTGSYMLFINENIQEQLQLPFLEKRKGQMADGSIKEYEVVGPVELKFKNRRTVINAMVLPGNN
ncbi:MAG: retropepsin-like domain-containing protein [Chitinophagaceae bacterium]|nr:retropepsin-like domain-containing protein [Chitinophagaceae bacterium]